MSKKHIVDQMIEQGDTALNATVPPDAREEAMIRFIGLAKAYFNEDSAELVVSLAQELNEQVKKN